MEKILFISENIPDSTKELLCTKGFSVRKLRKESSLPDAVSSHADMLIFSSSKALITAKNYYNSNKDIFEGSRVKCSNDTFGNVYPRDIIFNAFEINNTLFGKTDSLSSDVIKLYKKKVYLSQGYAKCSTLIFGNNAITADTGICKALSAFGINTLLINPASILLPGYNYGFIGGASFVFDKYVMFFGDLTLHPDSAEIIDFIETNGFLPIYDKSCPLTDFGGAVIDKTQSL